ncbi:ATP-NAD kinase, partial [Terfezia boudieri ATCC MYA-4762]
RSFSSSQSRRKILSIHDLPDRVLPQFSPGSGESRLLHLSWRKSELPRNVLLIKKPGVKSVRAALIEFATHLKATYPNTNIILEPSIASTSTLSYNPSITETLPGNELHDLPSPNHPYHCKVDFVTTFGGDGTILHAASLFATTGFVPPLLAFSMGTLGFLGEWKWHEHEAALYAVMEKGCKILRRGRLKVGLYNVKDSTRTVDENGDPRTSWHAMNEVVLHRGLQAHLVNLSVYINRRLLTTAVADGLILSTPTGSTAYSLSSGGPVLHPSVKALLLTPICPRSLSFRPLVVPHDEDVALRVGDGKTLEVSVDGRRWGSLEGGGETEVRVRGEVLQTEEGDWKGGIPCVKGPGKGKVTPGEGEDGDGGEGDGWVGGLKGVLKFNYAFGEED